MNIVTSLKFQIVLEQGSKDSRGHVLGYDQLAHLNPRPLGPWILIS